MVNKYNANNKSQKLKQQAQINIFIIEQKTRIFVRCKWSVNPKNPNFSLAAAGQLTSIRSYMLIAANDLISIIRYLTICQSTSLISSLRLC